MIEKLRKLGAWVWRSKERIVLAILVVVLAYRIYEVRYGQGPEETSAAGSTPIYPSEAYPTDKLPPPPPDMAGPSVPVPILTRNPLDWTAGSTSTGQGPETTNIVLVNLGGSESNPRVRIRFGDDLRRSPWMRPDQWDSDRRYRVVSIDLEGESCVLEVDGRRVTITKD